MRKDIVCVGTIRVSLDRVDVGVAVDQIQLYTPLISISQNVAIPSDRVDSLLAGVAELPHLCAHEGLPGLDQLTRKGTDDITVVTFD